MSVEVVTLATCPDLNISQIEETIELILKEHDASSPVTCIITNDSHIHQLNRDFRQKDTATDVLSFEMFDKVHPDSPLGEIYISVDRAIEQALQAGHTLHKETLLLAIHGTLHLLGYEHDTDPGYEKMRAREISYLEAYNNH